MGMVSSLSRRSLRISRLALAPAGAADGAAPPGGCPSRTGRAAAIGLRYWAQPISGRKANSWSSAGSPCSRWPPLRPYSALEVDGREHLLADDRPGQIGGVLRQGVDDRRCVSASSSRRVRVQPRPRAASYGTNCAWIDITCAPAGRQRRDRAAVGMVTSRYGRADDLAVLGGVEGPLEVVDARPDVDAPGEGGRSPLSPGSARKRGRRASARFTLAARALAAVVADLAHEVRPQRGGVEQPQEGAARDRRSRPPPRAASSSPPSSTTPAAAPVLRPRCAPPAPPCGSPPRRRAPPRPARR